MKQAIFLAFFGLSICACEAPVSQPGQPVSDGQLVLNNKPGSCIQGKVFSATSATNPPVEQKFSTCDTAIAFDLPPSHYIIQANDQTTLEPETFSHPSFDLASDQVVQISVLGTAYQPYTIAKLGLGTGVITSTTPLNKYGEDECGLNDRDTFSLAARMNVNTGITCTITAAPFVGSKFSGWLGGACTGTNPTCTFTIDAPTYAVAVFDRIGDDAKLRVTNGFGLELGFYLLGGPWPEGNGLSLYNTPFPLEFAVPAGQYVLEAMIPAASAPQPVAWQQSVTVTSGQTLDVTVSR
jgi:hypothetical protein